MKGQIKKQCQFLTEFDINFFLRYDGIFENGKLCSQKINIDGTI